MVKDKEHITRIFAVTERGRYHIMRRSKATYCNSVKRIVRVVHMDNLLASSICGHCVEAFKDHWKKEGWI